MKAEYGGRDHLDFAARNYVENMRREEPGIGGITYERALRNLVVAMYGHYVDLFRCHSSMAGHRIVLAYNCLEVAAKLGRYHWAVRRRQPGEELPDWIPTPEILAGESRLDYVDAFTLHGNAMHPAFGHPKTLARAYDQVYYEGREMGNLPLRGKKTADQSAAVYRAEYAQIVHHFSTLTRIDCEKFVRPMPTSLVRPEMVYPDKKYEAYCLKVLESRPVAQYKLISDYKMDGLQPKIDLRPGNEIPVYPEDAVDADPRFNEYPPYEEFMEGPEWTPGGIPPKIRSPENSDTSDTSIDTQAAYTIRAVLVTTDLEQGGVVTSTSTGQDTRRVELTPLPGLTQQFTIQVEREIQKEIQECSRQIVQDVLQRSANRIMPPTPLEVARASLSQCFQKALATPRTEPAPPPKQPRGQTKEESVQYSLADPFAGINPPSPGILKESHSAHPAQGRAATCLEWPPDEKKRRSSSHPRGEAEPKHGRSSGAEPSWDISKVGGRQSDKTHSQPTSEAEAPAPTPKLQSVVKSVHLKLPKPDDLESLGPAARSRYNDSTKDDRPRRDSSRHRADAHNKLRSGTVDKGSCRSDRGSGGHGWRSGQSPHPRSSKHKDKSLGAKLMARKEQEKKYKKIVENPMLYLEECQHQILPEEHQPEIHSLRFFGSGAEGAAIEVLALIDWAAEYVEISRSPVPEIPGFLRRPFIKGKLVKHPIPDDPAKSIHKEKCVWTKVQKAWTYLCALPQFWTDEVTTKSGEVMYGGWRRPANPKIAQIRATLNPSFGDHFKITWASIAVSTSWTQSHLYYRETDREPFWMEPGPTPDLQNPLEAAVEERWERYLKEGVLETADLSFSTPSWASAASMPLLLSGQPEARHPSEADSVPPGFTRIN